VFSPVRTNGGGRTSRRHDEEDNRRCEPQPGIIGTAL
jgi:hypothetical protein